MILFNKRSADVNIELFGECEMVKMHPFMYSKLRPNFCSSVYVFFFFFFQRFLAICILIG